MHHKGLIIKNNWGNSGYKQDNSGNKRDNFGTELGQLLKSFFLITLQRLMLITILNINKDI